MVQRQTTVTFGKGTVTKAIREIVSYNKFGVNTAKKWAKQRVQNEAASLQLIRAKTTIPVPKVLDVGEGPDGFYITTEFVDGVKLSEIGDQCYIPSERGHQAKNCTLCRQIAEANATNFIQKMMIPQLSYLISYQTGLNGTVIPPPWVTEHDRREEWPVKFSDTEAFFFNHGDLTAHNIMCNPYTLEVKCVFDWENGGYLPEEYLHMWAVNLDGYYSFFKDEERLERLIRSIEP